MKHFSLFLLLWLAIAMPKISNAQFSMDDITFWVGSGSNSAALVIDFNDGSTPQCYAWGFRFDGNSVTAADMIAAVDSADNALGMVVMSGFVSDITYLSHAGIGGSPDYFATFTGDGDSTHWTMNLGGSELLSDSMWFGMSYTPWDTSFNPVYVPGLPVAASPVNGLTDIRVFNTLIYPNPVVNEFNVANAAEFDFMRIFDMNGKLIREFEFTGSVFSLSDIPAGFYYAELSKSTDIIHRELIIKE
ncbi:hypothetical protein SDC9_116713 [bioreactor metagenome]|uniref:Secretion system C-terminal sorting domain-containing protein n=1 Tax=bioreactor metagenome TaxID=1076179 RepID=A0A645BWZ0_9ZZZZ